MTRLPRKNAITLGDALMEMIRQMKMSSGLNTQRIFSAWDEASGAGPCTLKKFFRDGILYITLNSSVIRSQLSFQKDAILEKINAILASDELFTKSDPKVGYVKEIRLK